MRGKLDPKRKPNLKRLKELLHYDLTTGIFTWRVWRKNQIIPGAVAGYNQNGYIVIEIDGRPFKAHRLAIYYTGKYWPENNIDHINRIKGDNRRSNLREVSSMYNARNSGNYSHNLTGVRGTFFCRTRKKYGALIRVGGKSYTLGFYNYLDNAVCARLAGEQFFKWDEGGSPSPAFRYVQKMIRNKKLFHKNILRRRNKL